MVANSTGNFCNFGNFLGRNVHHEFLKGTCLKVKNWDDLWSGEVGFT